MNLAATPAPKPPTVCPHCLHRLRSTGALAGHIQFNCPVLNAKRNGGRS